VPSARLVFSTGEWGSIAAMVITFLSALFIPLQDTIFLGAGLSLILYVVAASRNFRLQQGVRQADGSWVMQDTPKTLAPAQTTVLMVQGLDFFAEIPYLQDQMPSARGISGAVVVVVLRDLHQIGSTGIKWLERYAGSLQENGSLLILAGVNPKVLDTFKKSGALDVIGPENVFPATAQILVSLNMAWEAAEQWLKESQKTS